MDNGELRDVVKNLEQSFVKVLGTSAQKAAKLESIPAEWLHLLFKCAHDAVRDPITEKKVDPHLIADCTGLCKAVADAAVKRQLGEVEREPYELAASNAQKNVKKVQARLNKAEKAKMKAEKKVVTTGNKLKNASEKTLRKMQKAHDKAVRDCKKAQNTLQETTVAVQQAEKEASQLTSKYAQVLQVQKDIILSWQGVIGTLTSDKSCPACVDSCLLFLPMCPKCEVQQCACKWLR